MSSTPTRPTHPLSRDANPAFVRRAHLISGLTYPFWYLLTPAGAIDAWWTWAGVAAAFLASAALASRIGFFQRQLRNMFPGSWLVTLQVYVLASLNDMSLFYTVGSAIAVVAVSVMITTQSGLAAYGVFVATLGLTLTLIEFDPVKIAVWGGVLPVVVIAYQRLTISLSDARLSDDYQQQLERDVAERTRELADANERLLDEIAQRERLEEGLRFAQKMEAVGRLAGGVAHEFNNLLTTIRIYADTLHEGRSTPSEQHEDVGQIQKAARQAASLTQQLLTFSRRGTSQTQVLDVNEVVAETAPVLRRLFGEQIQLVLKPAEGRQPVRANRDQLEQALVNLAINARDAMPEGGTFTIETATLDSDALPTHASHVRGGFPADETVLLAVSDTGHGMDAETRARAFDPFFTRKPVDQGTGLGLSMVYGIVTQAGGHVRIQSEPGRGARLELYWPRAASYEPERAPAPSAVLRGRSERILLVENEGALRRGLCRALRDAGYRVEEAGDGETALPMAIRRDQPFDLVVSDVVMPGLSGLELAHELAGQRPGLNLLLISGQLEHPSLRDRELPETAAFLPKPFSLDELTTKVREVLDA